ncbi:MAG: hypothetical protein ACI4JB_05145 [Porcipelethomonas sp.]
MEIKLETLESIEKLLDSKPVYNEPVPVPDNEGFMQKMGKKLVTEEEQRRNKALSDFGYNQNSMNIDFMRAFLELQKYCQRLEQTLEEETANFRKTASAISVLKKELDNVRLRSTLNSNQIEKMDAGLCKYTEKLENYTLTIAPGARNADRPKGCIEADISDVIGYYDRIENAKKAADTTELEKFCHAAMSKSLAAFDAYDEVVVDFYGSDRYAAVLYGNLNRNSVYKIKLLKERDLPGGHFSVICTDNAFVPRKLMLKSAVVVVTGDSPFEDVQEDDIENLRFLNDCGLHTYVTLSEQSYREFTEKGFRCVTAVTPDKLMSGAIVRTVEKAMESAVPAGAVSYSTLQSMLDGADSYFMTDPEEIAGYIGERLKVYPYNCLNVMENTAAGAIKNNFFPTGIVTACRISKTTEGLYGFIDGMNYVNHLNYENRKKVYSKVKTMLEPEGIFLMNGYDAVVGVKIRALKGWNYYPAYEALWTREQLINELEENGFKIKFLIPTGAGLFDNLPPKYRKTPAEWIVGVTM